MFSQLCCCVQEKYEKNYVAVLSPKSSWLSAAQPAFVCRTVSHLFQQRLRQTFQVSQTWNYACLSVFCPHLFKITCRNFIGKQLTIDPASPKSLADLEGSSDVMKTLLLSGETRLELGPQFSIRFVAVSHRVSQICFPGLLGNKSFDTYHFVLL